MKTLITLIGFLIIGSGAHAGPVDEIKRSSDKKIRSIVEPILQQYCAPQCQIISVDTQVDVAVDEISSPGFEDQVAKSELAASESQLKLLVDENLGANKRMQITNLIKEHLEELSYPVTVEARLTQFPRSASSTYRVAELRERVSREVQSSVQEMLRQFCGNQCLLGDFEVKTEVVNPADVDFASSKEYYQDGPAAIRVRGVTAMILMDDQMAESQAAGVMDVVQAKLEHFKNSEVLSQSIHFPQRDETGRAIASVDGVYGSNSKSLKNSKNENVKQLNENRLNTRSTENKGERFERYEKIERVENGDAVQKKLEEFKWYGIVLSASIIALLLTLVAIAFRKQIFEFKSNMTKRARGAKSAQNEASEAATTDTTANDRGSVFARRIEAEHMFDELTNIYSEQPKVAKHVFTHVLTEEGVEVTAQYLQIFGESVVMDLLRDPGLQADLSELMDFYARNTFEINDEERFQLLKRLHHRTVTAKLQVHGSRSAALFDFLTDMDSPQIGEMIKNESMTVKAIVMTQCDSKKRQALFNRQDEASRLKLMTELSRIDHLPKSYVSGVATALRRKKQENPKLNTEALPGTDVLVTFLEKSGIDTQRTVLHQMLNSAGADTIQSVKSKLVSLETLRFMKDHQVTEVIAHIKHDELVQFVKGCDHAIREGVLAKVPEDLAADLREECEMVPAASREAYSVVERKVLNRIKVMANNGEMSLADINERMFSQELGVMSSLAAETPVEAVSEMKKVG